MKMLAKSIAEDVTIIKPLDINLDKTTATDLTLYELMLQSSDFGYLYKKQRSHMIFEGDSIPTIEVVQKTGDSYIVTSFCESDGSYISSFVEQEVLSYVLYDIVS